MVSRRLDEAQDTLSQSNAEMDGDRQACDEAELHRAQDTQGERMEALGRLANGVAHDFNNLLGMILNYAAFVAEELVTIAECPPECVKRCEETKRDVAQIQQAAARTSELTHQLLAFARREVIRPQVPNLNEVVWGVEEVLRRAMRETTELSLSLGEDTSDTMSDTGTLPADTANIVADADSGVGRSPATPGRYVQLRISDGDAGIFADVASLAFEPSCTTKGEGARTGLGLATPGPKGTVR
jgi:C4-dicarboxylate-specific signal transduction histidine kinase